MEDAREKLSLVELQPHDLQNIDLVLGSKLVNRGVTVHQ
jgi:hypothetical protein